MKIKTYRTIGWILFVLSIVRSLVAFSGLLFFFKHFDPLSCFLGMSVVTAAISLNPLSWIAIVFLYIAEQEKPPEKRFFKAKLLIAFAIIGAASVVLLIFLGMSA